MKFEKAIFKAYLTRVLIPILICQIDSTLLQIGQQQHEMAAGSSKSSSSSSTTPDFKIRG